MADSAPDSASGVGPWAASSIEPWISAANRSPTPATRVKSGTASGSASASSPATRRTSRRPVLDAGPESLATSAHSASSVLATSCVSGRPIRATTRTPGRRTTTPASAPRPVTTSTRKRSSPAIVAPLVHRPCIVFSPALVSRMYPPILPVDRATRQQHVGFQPTHGRLTAPMPVGDASSWRSF